MADDDWKKRVGIEINFSSDDEDTGGDTRCNDDNPLSPVSNDSPESSFEGRRFFGDDILNEYAEYGSTPPRTRISRRLREHKQRTGTMSATKPAAKIIHAKATRRNTLDSLYFSELLERSDLNSSQGQTTAAMETVPRPESIKRVNSKRTMKLLRGSERDLKLDIPSAARGNVGGTGASDVPDDRAESLPVLVPQPAIKVETCNRFLSLTSKLVACRAFKRTETSDRDGDCLQSRVDFYNTFSLLIRMGSGDKQSEKNPRRLLSREEHLWQNELKDLIWLELQAWHAGRTLTEQDTYLCKAREEIEPLLEEIMQYKFVRQKPTVVDSPSSTRSQDSGLSPDLMADSDIICCAAKIVTCSCVHHKHEPPRSNRSCVGCLSMYCHDCNEAQETALREIQGLLNRLEAAEALYPSSKAFAVHYPLYLCKGFVGRVKAMCLWYNMTVHNRLKLKILGKLLMLSVFQDKKYRWPSFVDEEGSSGIGSETPGSDVVGSDVSSASRRSSLEERNHASRAGKRSVQFDVDSTSPSDSNNSTASHGTSSSDAEVGDRLRELYDIRSVSNPGPPVFVKNPTKNPYRKYIEEVLKTKGLRKALSFLESLHTSVLLKSLLTLERPAGRGGGGGESTDTIHDTLSGGNFRSIDQSDSEEMRRYGYWSCETRALSLPSYRSAFLFLSRIPLDVIHEFLRMRLEQKPDHPSVLSIRQLMRELKEGLGIAVLHRVRYLQLIRTVLWDVEPAILEQFEKGVLEFDKCVKSVLEVYLDYLQQWVQMVQQESFRKHILEEEWTFVKDTCPHICDGEELSANTFCLMASGMLASVGEFIQSSIQQIRQDMGNNEQCTEDNSPRQCILLVCRDLQSVLNVARVRSLRAVSFAKMLRKDLTDEGSQRYRFKIEPTVLDLKMEALLLGFSIAQAIRDVDALFDCRDFEDLEETDRAAVLNRCREVLHLAFKFGFEYHKETCRLIGLTGDKREKLSRGLISFAKLWMTFVKERCERGRGLRPRWANQGLDFLMTICDPHHTNFLSDAEFEALKSAMDQCISHVIGQPPATPEKPPSPLPPSPRSPRSSIDYSRSPLPIRARVKNSKTLHGHRRTPSGNVVVVVVDDTDGNIAETLNVSLLSLTRQDRLTAAVTSLDEGIDERLRRRDLIGSVTDVESEDKIHIRLRSVTFGWQRGIKIGQGSYGKVYTAVNNQTGELMAMKEIQLQPNDHRTIRRVAEELRIFEGIKHQHLVRYYGVEIHREEMLIFMEFCAEGTLESLVAGTETGLPEALVRRYTRQLLHAMAVLHRNGVVHRDVKSANIFLTDEGNCLKLGDFGSAVKIKAHTTLPGELQGFVGTQAYMAPEVFMKTTTEGHGRAADIWSIGCVVVEMASGERPWAEFDSNYQIMFKVGMGETPAVPDTLSEEGIDFLRLCLQHDARQRAAAEELLQHAFGKVDGDEESVLSLPM